MDTTAGAPHRIHDWWPRKLRRGTPLPSQCCPEGAGICSRPPRPHPCSRFVLMHGLSVLPPGCRMQNQFVPDLLYSALSNMHVPLSILARQVSCSFLDSLSIVFFPPQKYKAVYKKFTHRQFDSVALLPSLQPDDPVDIPWKLLSRALDLVPCGGYSLGMTKLSMTMLSISGLLDITSKSVNVRKYIHRIYCVSRSPLKLFIPTMSNTNIFFCTRTFMSLAFSHSTQHNQTKDNPAFLPSKGWTSYIGQDLCLNLFFNTLWSATQGIGYSYLHTFNYQLRI